MWNRRKYLIKADTLYKNLNKKVSSINLVFSDGDDTKNVKKNIERRFYKYIHIYILYNKDCINKYN